MWAEVEEREAFAKMKRIDHFHGTLDHEASGLVNAFIL